ncbi:hypothetical protein SASPL_145462 [Salvia splendens]|uniref:Uncharacterized protein n=1 Tax=Salvia splendens TaxID=180675 RepID=A0A8X8Z7E2_SALSN|nr:hypothetical protein SASPL_145462 [Salvia splendens]
MSELQRIEGSWNPNNPMLDGRRICDYFEISSPRSLGEKLQPRIRNHHVLKKRISKSGSNGKNWRLNVRLIGVARKKTILDLSISSQVDGPGSDNLKSRDEGLYVQKTIATVEADSKPAVCPIAEICDDNKGEVSTMGDDSLVEQLSGVVEEEIVNDGLIKQLSGVVEEESMMLGKNAIGNSKESGNHSNFSLQCCLDARVSVGQIDHGQVKKGMELERNQLKGTERWLLDGDYDATGHDTISKEDNGELKEMRYGERGSGKTYGKRGTEGRGFVIADDENMEKKVVAHVPMSSEHGCLANACQNAQSRELATILSVIKNLKREADILGVSRRKVVCQGAHAWGLEQGLQVNASKAIPSSTKETMAVRDVLNSALDEGITLDSKVLVKGEEFGKYHDTYKLTKGLLDKLIQRRGGAGFLEYKLVQYIIVQGL